MSWDVFQEAIDAIAKANNAKATILVANESSLALVVYRNDQPSLSIPRGALRLVRS